MNHRTLDLAKAETIFSEICLSEYTSVLYHFFFMMDFHLNSLTVLFYAFYIVAGGVHGHETAKPSGDTVTTGVHPHPPPHPHVSTDIHGKTATHSHPTTHGKAATHGTHKSDAHNPQVDKHEKTEHEHVETGQAHDTGI